MSAVLCTAKQHREISIQLALEVLIEHRLQRRDGRRRGVREVHRELVEVHADETQRALLIEHREKNAGAARRFCLGEEDLAVLAGVMQSGERLALQLPAELRGGPADRRR